MENQSDTNSSDNIDIEDTWENNFNIMRDRMNNVSNRIDKAITDLKNQKRVWIREDLTKKISMLEAKSSKDDDEIKQLKKGNILLDKIINEKKTVISSLELSIKHWLRRFEQVQIENADLSDNCIALQKSQSKAERETDERQKQIDALQDEVRILKMKLQSNEQNMKLYSYEQENKSGTSFNISQDNFVNIICSMSQIIGSLNKELLQEKLEKQQCIINLEAKEVEVKSLAQRLETVKCEVEAREKEALAKAPVQADIFTIVSHEAPYINVSGSSGRDTPHNADNTSTCTQSSTESSKMASDLQKTINYKNSTITTLQGDIIYKECLIAELENKLLNMTKELQASKRNYHQLCDVMELPSLGW